MRVWTVANQKGGVGKTTTTISLAGLLAAQRHDTLLVDMDPHGSLTSYLGLDPDVIDRGLYALFETYAVGTKEPVDTLIRCTELDHIHILPASMALATLDRQLGSREGMGLVLTRALTNVSSRFDFVLIDCPAILGVLMVNALAVCEHLIIPVQTEFLALKGLERMIGTVNMIMRARKIPVPYTIVPTLYDRRTRAARESLLVLRERYANQLCDGVIPIDTQFREASKAGAPISSTAPASHGAQAYRMLLDMLLAGGQARPQETAAL